MSHHMINIFSGRKYKSQRFKDWIFTGLNLDIKPSVHCLEMLSYLAYETVAQVFLFINGKELFAPFVLK